MEKELYQKPVLEVIDFSVRDVITTSGTDVGVDMDSIRVSIRGSRAGILISSCKARNLEKSFFR